MTLTRAISTEKTEGNTFTKKIDQTVYVGRYHFNEDAKKTMHEKINRMKNENGIEAIVLGCTELPLLLNDEVSSVPCLDTMQIHISSIIKTI